ncbi:MAG: transglutaminase domain-containing protein [Cytophagales bacterium]|nr:transglutaminase domain-containing protein [Cytophagales bacterium]
MQTDIIRLFATVVLLICFRPTIQAKDSINYRLYNHVVDIPDKYERSKKRFIKYLQLEASNDAEMVESIYYWMTFNIAYDQAIYDKTQNLYLFTDSFFSRKGICSEYSRLFVELCDLAGLEVEFLAGYARTNTFTGALDSNARHSWNRVKLNDEWNLIDTTWGSRSKLKGEQVIKRKPNLYYLFISPEDLIKTHFPAKTEWQMLDKPLTEQEFLSQ